MSLTFSIDTTSPYCSIAVMDKTDILAEYNFFSSGELSETLISTIDMVLTSLKISINEISLIGAATGPGLFTGIRVGLATLKGLFFEREIPVVPVSSLHAIAAKSRITDMDIVPLIDARRGEIYTATYQLRERIPALKSQPSLMKADALRDSPGINKKVCFTGSGALVYRDLLSTVFPGSVIEHRSPFIAAEIGLIASAMYKAGDYLTGMAGLEPLYIRIPDAEKNFKSGNN